MLGYTQQNLADMTYGVYQADLLIDADENPAIHNYLVMANDFLQGLWAEGYFDHAQSTNRIYEHTFNQFKSRPGSKL